MHDKIDAFFSAVWSKVPFGSPVIFDWILYNLEIFMHKAANLIEFSEDYK